MKEEIKENVREVDLIDFFKPSFYEYGMAVIEDRALPDVRDGLKPVHRAITYEILKSGVTSKSKPTKVARIAGNVIGNWHPHGDKAVEDALTGMAEPWSNTLPTVWIKGNGGSIFGDGAAAGRYIEARLTPAGDAYGYKLKKGIVPYVPNFDDTGEMPTVLPAQLPYLLINGIKEGIAVGVAASLPPHNANEVLDMTLAYLKNPKIKTEELLEYMPGPDFPSGATIINKDDMLKIYEEGEGKIVVRATVEYDKKEHALHVKEIPYLFAGSMDNLVTELAAATTESLDKNKKRIPPKVTGINAVNNYSGKDGIDICLELQKGVDPDEMLKTLYAKTRLETTVKFIFNALNDKVLHTNYSLRQYLAEYAQFQHETVKNEHKIEQDELNRRLEIIMGRIIAASYIDEIVDVVKNSNGRTQIKDVLMNGTLLPNTNPKYHGTVKTFAFTETQADAISEMPLYQLNKLDVEKLKKEGKEIQTRLKVVEKIVVDQKYRHKLIIKRLEEEKKKLPDSPRKTKIIQDSVSKASALETPTVSLYVSMDKYGYVRIENKQFDGASITDNKSRIGFFDEKGNCWNLFLDKAKETKERGTLVSRLTMMEGNVIGFTAGMEKEGKGLFIFENGAMRRTEMKRYLTKSRATKINTRTMDQPLKAFYDIPEGVNIVTIDGVDIPLEKVPLQGLSGSGKAFLAKKEEPYVVTFKQGEIKAVSKTKNKDGNVFDAVVSFTADGKLLFDWTTLDMQGKDGLYVTTYQKLLKETLLFVHSDGTAKRVLGEQFKIKTKRTQVVADKEGMTAIYIQPATEETLIGHYEGGRQKRIDASKIPVQGKSGGGVRVFYAAKYKFQRVESGKGSDLPIVSFATLPKEVKTVSTNGNRVQKAKELVLERLEYVTDCQETPDFVEITGSVGGDVRTYRVYDDGNVYEK